MPPQFHDFAAKDLTLWRVLILVLPAYKHNTIILIKFDSATELDPTDDIFDDFEDQPPKKKLNDHLTTGHLLDLVRNVYEDSKGCIIKHGCLPKIKDDTKLLVVHDELHQL
ncbi:hypothetical protein BGZ82_010009 [Podila clonocystis]|nr:hypothetical protein BGZ82_010009 [Podila clonocystis]